MSKDDFSELFVELLTDMFSGEQQIIDGLPKVIKAVTMPELKEAFQAHLEETKNQLIRLKQIFSILQQEPLKESNANYVMESLIAKCEEIVKRKAPQMVKESALIAAAQCIEHYEMAMYGTLATYAEQLGHKDIVEILEATLHEESKADKKLTRIAQGGFFATGVNKLAQEQ